ncbi:MAG: VWA domain-containing protein [Endomicrobia bacterium]|nr:VWA domain-containing protein [Endomicrobiia bacterium]
MRFANPMLLILLLLALLLFLFLGKRTKKGEAFISFPLVSAFKGRKQNQRVFLLKLLEVFKYLVVIILIIAAARPQEGRSFEQANDSGINIMIALDTSSSMQAPDFAPLDRMQAAKKVAADFVNMRNNDKIGLVAFAGLAFTQSPLTTDKSSLAKFIEGINIGDTGVDGTAIGSAIMTAANRLKDSKGKSKIIILITDGNNNMGEIDPVTASKVAKSLGIKIYTIGVGRKGGGGFLGGMGIVTDELNEEPLMEIASNTGGEYFRAGDAKSFADIMKTIDALEKDDISSRKFVSYKELFQPFVLFALIAMLLAVFLENTYLRKIP